MKPTSIRFTEAEQELIDAMAAFLGSKRGRPVSKTEVVSTLLRRAKPTQDLGPEAARVRAAYINLVGEEAK